MADLDDFFAKKDKKKSKSKKFVSTEELVKQLDTAAKEKEQSKTKPAKIDEESSEQIANQEKDDEWKDFEEEKRPDLSNLKLGQLTIDGENENNQNSGGNEYDYENSQYDGDSSENPWKKANSAASAPAAVAKPIAAPAAQTGKYVPPSERNENAMKMRGGRRNAPDLKNQEYFPSLGTDKPVEPPKPSKKDGFQMVEHGGKSQSATAGTAPVSIGNAYSSLLSESLDS